MLAPDECSWLALETNIAGSQLGATSTFAPMEEQVSIFPQENGLIYLY